MAEPDGRELVKRYLAALGSWDWAALGTLVHADFVEEWPQSGERIRGASNVRAILQNYPGGLPESGLSTRRVTGGGEESAVAVAAGFGYHVARVTGAGNTFTFEATASYGDGSATHMVGIVQVRDGRVWKQTTYFAAPFEPPAWRAQWVELAQT